MKLSRSSFPKCALYQMCFLFLLLLFTNAQTNSSKIPIGSSLKAGGMESSWTSASGNFAFGFQPVKDEGFLLAIWFNEIPEKTIVWSANRVQLVQSGSVVEFSTNGGLVLTDQSGQQVWSSDTAGTGVSYAAMLETGNFVLAKNDSANLWQSFDHPTDTILPLQVLNKGDRLIANYLETNFSEGRFMIRLDTSGDLVMYTTDYPFNRANQAYMSSLDNTSGSGSQLVYNQSGFVFVASENGSLLYSVFPNAESTDDLYQRATMDYDGVFRQYVYPRGNKSAGAWTKSWSILSFTPPNICLSIRQDVGSGACGFNSYCKMEDGSGPKCVCPSGYTLLDPNDERKGCKQNFAGQLCDDASQDTDQYEIIDMAGIDWPLSDYEHYDQTTEDWCRQACLSDCFCAVAIIRDGNCWKKKLPLYNGRFNLEDGGKALIKVRTGGFLEPISKRKDRTAMLIGGSVTLGSSILLNFLLLVAAFVFFSRFSRSRQQSPRVVPEQKIHSFTYNELESATGGFKEEVGSGSFGNVYKGILPNDNKVVAVKKLNRMERDGEDGFDSEVSVIGGTNHRNLVQLLGFCNEGQHRLLIYEFMSNGSLANFLFGDTRPNWFRRTQIAIGIARGLFYLHEECTSQIIHCDIKPQNILLDESLTPRISDFGISKFLKIDQTRTTTKIRGTKGYVAPEWFRSMPITSKVDVYSFGIVLLELVCCRRNVEQLDQVGEDQIILADWTLDCYRDSTLQLLVEQDEEATDDINRVKKYLMVAMWCIQEDPCLRPTMKKVVQMLEGSVQVPAPPDPASFISQI